MFRKNIISVLALVIALISLVVACFAAVTASRAAKAQPKMTAYAEPTDLSVPAKPADTLAVAQWTLTPSVQPEGVAVSLSAALDTNLSDLTGSLLVRQNDDPVSTVPCAFDGSALTAQVTLPPANGYTYILVLGAPGRDRQEFVLTSPEDPVDVAAVNLEDSLRAYCTLDVQDWAADSAALTIRSGRVQLQLPRLAETEAAPESARLSLKMKDKQIASQELTLQPSADPHCYELALENVALPLGEMKPGEELTLWLEVTLSGGEQVRATGAAWFLDGDNLSFIAG